VRSLCSSLPARTRGACRRRQAEALQRQWLSRLAWGPQPEHAAEIQLWLGLFPVSWQQMPDVVLLEQQIATIRQHLGGSFTGLLTAMVLDPALQLSLNGPANHRSNPNENLARELLELFSLGEGHYSETDVREAARALSGYRLDAQQQLVLDPRRHDSGSKTILGRRADFNAASLALWLAEQPATARHINSLIASYSLARAKPAPAYSDTFLATFQHDYILSPKYRIVSQTSFLRDPPKTITKHTEQLIGFARTLVQTPSTTFMVAPGLAYSFGEKEYVGDVDDQHFGYGFYQILNHSLSPTLSLQQKLKAVRSFSDPQYIRASASVSLTVQLTKTIGLQTSLESTYDGRPAQGIEELQYQTNTGLQFKF